MNPTVLIVTTSRWFPTARLGMALAKAGCTVDAVCPPGHALGKMSLVRRTYPYRGLMPLRAFRDAISASSPDFVLPGDDLATCHLHRLYEGEHRRGEAGRPMCELIERSLGAPESFPVVYARTAFMNLAHEAGIRAPQTEVVSNFDELRKWVARMGLPTVLKVDGTSGGEGVRVVHTLEEAERAFRTLQAPPLLARAAKRALVDQDKTLVWPSLLRRRSLVNAQVFVAGERGYEHGRLLARKHPRQPSFRGAPQAGLGGAIERPAFHRECRNVNGCGNHGPPVETFGHPRIRFYVGAALGKRPPDRNQSPCDASWASAARAGT